MMTEAQRRSEPDAFVVWIDALDAKEAMLENEPATFFMTDHEDGHPIMLVRLDAIDRRLMASARAEEPREGGARPDRRTIVPTILGAGIPLFAGATRRHALELIGQ